MKILQEGTVDYLAFSYYKTNIVTTDKSKIDKDNKDEFSTGVDNPYLKKTDWGWAIDPKGIRYTLDILSERYELPLMIVENGIGLHETRENEQSDGMIHDDKRIAYFQAHIEQMKKQSKKTALIYGDICRGAVLTLFPPEQEKWKNGMVLFMSIKIIKVKEL